MKLVKRYLTCYGLSLCALFLLYQPKCASQSKISPIKTGDVVPDIEFQNVLNYKTKKVKLSAFRGKLVILDLWSTWCSSCIEAFPKMERIQNEFKDQIQILLVNPYDEKYDSEQKIRLMLEKNKKRTGFYPSLPIPIHDTVLNSYFPHQSVPHQVWIDQQGKVISITGANEVTSKNVKTFLDEKVLNVVAKDDLAFDRNVPLLVDGNGGGSGDFISRALFTNYKGVLGYGTSLRMNTNKDIIGLCMLNKSMRSLVSSAYHEEMNGMNPNRIFFDVSNPEKYKMEFDSAYAYCYDLAFPPIKSSSLKVARYLKEDLKRFFNVAVHMEKRKLPCLIIGATSKLGKTLTNKQTPNLDLDKKSIRKFIHHYSISDVIGFLNNFEKPFINETGISEQKIDLDFPDHFDLSDEKAVIEVLKKAGFEIREKERELDVVVISDK